LNLSAIFSKTGKGVQEASGKTSNLSRGDRAVLSAIDGKTPLSEVQGKFEKLAGPKFEALIQQFDKDGYIREVSSGSQPATQAPRPGAPAAKAAPPPPKPADDSSDGLDFTQAIKLPPKAAAPKPPTMDLAAAARADAERKAKEQQATDYKARQEAEAKAKAEAELKARAAAEARARAQAEASARAAAEAKAREAAEAKGRADAEAKARAEAEMKARADAEAKTRAETEAKVKAAREAAVRMATEAKAKAEADAKAKAEAAERDKAKLEAELNAKLAAERKAREDAERRAAEASELARKELEEKAKRDADELRQRLEAEMKAKLEEERKAREAEDRKRREEEDRRRKEEDERRAKEDAERRAREEADRKKREEEDRKRKEEDDRRRKEEDDRRTKEANERRVREEADREKRVEDERKRREQDERRRKEEDERRAKEEAERRAREDADRKAKEEAERKARDEADAKARAVADLAASLPKVEVAAPPLPAAAAPAGDLGDLLGDLDSFGKREEEEQKAKEEAERKAKEEAARKAKEAAERKEKEEADRKRREEEERRRKEEEEKRAKEEDERKAREAEEHRKEEEAERKRKAKEAQAAKQAEERAAKAAARKSAGKGDDDVEIGDEDLDTDDIKRDQKALAARAAARDREQPQVAAASSTRPKKWGKPAAIALFVLLVGGIGALNLMPVSTAEYEKAASDAIGLPVKIGSARLSVLTGVEMKFEGVAIGDAVKIRLVRGFPELGSLFGARKSFSRIELEGVSVSQSQIADALLGKVAGENLRISRVVIKELKLDGPLNLPPLDVDATVAGDGSLQAVKLTGGDKLTAQLSPKGGDIAFEISAGSLALPFVPALSLSDFSMKGTANRSGVASADFDGRAFDGVISGTTRIRWGANWTVDGELRARAVRVAVFAPALVSEGKVEGRAAYSMSGTTPARLFEGAHMQGEFKIEQGVLGSFDLTRALQTGGSQSSGRTVFAELTGQGVYDKGAIQLRNIAMTAGAMNAGASVDIDANGGIAGRVAADVKTPNQTLRATLNISGKVQDPVIRK